MVARVKTDRAESTGGAWESVIENYAHLLGYSETGKATMEQLMSHHINGTGVQEGMFAADDEKSQMGYAAKARVPNRNNEGKPRYADFVLYHAGKEMPFVAVHCKWQRSAGTVDRKYGADVRDAKRAAIPSVFVLGGGGASKDSRQIILDGIDNVTVLALCDGPEELREWLDHSWTEKIGGRDPLPM